jgi:hypothetical protein
MSEVNVQQGVRQSNKNYTIEFACHGFITLRDERCELTSILFNWHYFVTLSHFRPHGLKGIYIYTFSIFQRVVYMYVTFFGIRNMPI